MLSNSQSKILGYVISAGGNHVNGVTIAEIIAATGLSQNAVYTQMRKGVPGVLECVRRNPQNNSRMFYTNADAIATMDVKDKQFTGSATPTESSSDDMPKLLSTLGQHLALVRSAETNVDAKPASYERLSQIVHTINNPPSELSDSALRQFYMVAGLTLAGIAERLKDE